MFARSRTLTLLTALPLVLGMSATAAHASPATAPAAARVVATSPAPPPGPATAAAAEAAAAAAAADAWGGYSNGYIPASALCPIPWKTGDLLRCDAAAKFVALNALYKAKFGANICVNDAYRSYADQVSMFKLYGYPRAAMPGTSNHGWAIAADLGCGVGIFGDPKYVWFTANAPKYGWAQPTWALQRGSNPEAWHWQYFGAYISAPAATATTKVATTANIVVTGTWPRVAKVTIRNKATGAVMAGVPVTIKRRALASTAWVTVGTFPTNSAGWVTETYFPNTPTVVTMSYAGSVSALPSAAGVTLTAPTVISARVVTGRPDTLIGRLLTYGGQVLPAQTVYVQRHYAGSATWANVATLRTGSTGYVSYQMQPKRGTYYRFYFPSRAGQYVGDFSPSLYVTY